MNSTVSIRLGIFLVFFIVIASSAQTVREQFKEPEFKLYCVIFGVTIDADSKLQSFKVSRIIDFTSGTTDPVDIPVPQAFINDARKKVEAKHFKPKLKDGKPVEFFTYFGYTPKNPALVITDLDQPLDKQP